MLLLTDILLKIPVFSVGGDIQKKYPDRNGRDIRKGCRLVVHADAVLVD